MGSMPRMLTAAVLTAATIAGGAALAAPAQAAPGYDNCPVIVTGAGRPPAPGTSGPALPSSSSIVSIGDTPTRIAIPECDN